MKTLVKFIFCLFIIGGPIILTAKDGFVEMLDSVDSLIDNKDFLKAKELIVSGDYHCKTEEDWIILFEKEVKLGKECRYAGEIDQSLNLFKGLLKKLQTNFFHKKELIALIIHQIGLSYSAKRENLKAIFFYKKAIEIRSTIFEKPNYDILNGYFNVGNKFYELQQIDSANLYLKTGLKKNFSSVKNAKLLGKSYLILGRVALLEQQTDLAEEYLKNALVYLEQSNDMYNLATAFETYSDIFAKNKKYQLAIKNIYRSITILGNLREKGFLSNLDLRNKYFNLGLYYSEIDSFQLAIEFHSLADSLGKEFFKTKVNEMTPKFYRELGKINYQMRHFEESTIYILKAIDLNEKFDFQETNYKNHQLLGDNYYKLGNYLRALDAYQTGINLITNDCCLNTPFELPQLNRIERKYLVEALELSIRKSKALNQLLKDNPAKYLQPLLANDDFILELVFHIRKNFSSNFAKAKISQKILPYLEVKIKNYVSGNLAQQENRLDKVMECIELNKSLILLEAFYTSKAKQQSGVDKQHFFREQQLLDSIALFEKQVKELTLKEVSELKVAAIRDLQFQYKLKLNEWVEKTQKEFPQYFNIRNNFKLLTLSNLKEKSLYNNQSLISYFVGDSTIHTFHITSNNQSLISIPKDFPLSDWIEKMRSGIYNHYYDASSFPYEKMNEQYTKYAHLLYQKLIAPINNLKEEVIIIPDGELGYIPFDALLMEKTEKPENFATHAYFGKKHPITYNYSATLWQQMRAKKAQKGEVLTFAPKFKENPNTKLLFADVTTRRRDDLWHLVYNVDEIKGITNQIGGQVYEGKGASLENFKSVAKYASIFHFATHAKLDDEDNDFSYLAFSQLDDSTEYKMYIKDLYNMHLPVQMVVLSACETGLGELKKGEGIYSLSRGFAYAGAKSIINSLWSVNDEKASELMIQFYANLRDQKTSKSIALHQAKVNYLEQCKTNGAAHPYYWAAFVPLGDMSPIELESSLVNCWTIAGALIFLILLGLFGRKYF